MPLMPAKSVRYIPSLDGLRGLGSVFVIATHYGYFLFGWVGLEFFFVLSGFLITGILLTDADRRLGEYLGRFYWRRLLRTFPAYFGYLIICGLVYMCLRQPSGFLGVLPSLATYWYNFKVLFDPLHSNFLFLHLWSMSVEEQFYLVWPLLVFVLSAANLRRVIIAIVFLIPLLRIAVFAYYRLHGVEDFYASRLFFFATPFRLDAFSIGAALAVFRLTERELKLRWFFLVSAFVLALGLINASIGINPYKLLPSGGELFTTGRFLGGISLGYPQFLLQNRQFLWGNSVIDLWCAALIISASQQNALQRFCENRFLWHLGRISYGFYIFQMAILGLFKPIIPVNPWSLAGFGVFVVLFVITFGVAHLSYFCFERKFLMLKDYFGKRKAGFIAPE
jgi:peptidoglycan/LPS O-acetylase OafA/YrhL